MQRFLIDIDDHIFFSEKKTCKECKNIKYKLKDIDRKEIKAINEMYGKGHEIIFWTSRGWVLYDYTFKELRKKGVLFHQLIMGKMTGIYVDKQALHSIKDFKDE